LGTEKQQLLIVITVYLTNEAARVLYWQTKGLKLGEIKLYICEGMDFMENIVWELVQ